MGIPKFFRWLSERYPLINQTINHENVGPVFDNLYLDMNGIIHNCTHANSDQDSVDFVNKTEEDMIIGIFKYIENLVSVVKPQKLLFLAIDGVAPRAKMNQQRARRFRTAREAEEAMKLKEEGKRSGTLFDSNCITPGTEFMARLSEHLKFFISKKIEEDLLWRSIQIIFSGHETPGEGEHKIMEYIRGEKGQPGYDPNLVHCMYGLDADLMMLSLVTHEPNFALLREEGVLDRRKKKRKGDAQEFHLLHISLLREYLFMEFSRVEEHIAGLFEFEPERMLDDFVMLCFLIGNDFVPNLPGLDIASGDLNHLISLYLDALPSLGGYINIQGQPVMSRLEVIFKLLSQRDQAAVVSHDESDEYQVVRENYYRSKFGREYELYGLGEELLGPLRKSYLEAICWVAHYYYHGCVSWSWYYPFHYTPLAFDMNGLEAIDISFTLSKPFKPLQQLLAVLPAASRLMLPKAYRPFMVDMNSPMQKYYPLHFDYDMNGKKNDWEAVVIIPFIDAELLIKCTEIVDYQLTKEEQLRNAQKDAILFRYHPEVQHVHYSTLPAFWDIQCHSTARKWAPRALPQHVTHPFFLLPDTIMGRGSPAGIPSMKSAPFTFEICDCGVNIFGSTSKKESLMIVFGDAKPKKKLNTLEDLEFPQGDNLQELMDEQAEEEANQQSVDLEEIASTYLGRMCWIWPYNKEAFVENISCRDGEYRFDLVKPVWNSFSEEQGRIWIKDCEILYGKLKMQKAVEIRARRPLLLFVRPVIGVVLDQYGQSVPRYSDFVERVPLGLVSATPWNIDVNKFSIKNYESLMVNMKCVSLRPDSYGTVCEVEALEDKEGLVTVSMLDRPRIPPFLSSFIASTRFHYYQMGEVSHRLGITNYVLSQITGAVVFEPNLNLGLNLKFSSKNLQVTGYTRRVSDTAKWEFSQLAIDLVIEYKRRYPEVFFAVDRNAFDANLLFPNSEMILVDEKDNVVDPNENEEVDYPEETSTFDKIKVPLANKDESPFTTLADEGELEDEPADSNGKPALSSSESSVREQQQKLLSEAAQFSLNEAVQATLNGPVPVVVGEGGLPKHKEGKLISKRLYELKLWLKNLPHNKYPRMPCGSKGLLAQQVKELETKIDEFVNSEKKNATKKPVTEKISPNLLLKPLGVYESQPDEHFELGSRVMCVRASGPIPFGSVGTVVAIHDAFLDVFFDETHLGGTSLDGFCSNFRGQTLLKGAFMKVKDASKRIDRQQQRQNKKATTNNNTTTNNGNAWNHQNDWVGKANNNNNYNDSSSPQYANKQQQQNQAPQPQRSEGKKKKKSETHEQQPHAHHDGGDGANNLLQALFSKASQDQSTQPNPQLLKWETPGSFFNQPASALPPVSPSKTISPQDLFQSTTSPALKRKSASKKSKRPEQPSQQETQSPLSHSASKTLSVKEFFAFGGQSQDTSEQQPSTNMKDLLLSPQSQSTSLPDYQPPSLSASTTNMKQLLLGRDISLPPIPTSDQQQPSESTPTNMKDLLLSGAKSPQQLHQEKRKSPQKQQQPRPSSQPPPSAHSTQQPIIGILKSPNRPASADATFPTQQSQQPDQSMQKIAISDFFGGGGASQAVAEKPVNSNDTEGAPKLSLSVQGLFDMKSKDDARKDEAVGSFLSQLTPYFESAVKPVQSLPTPVPQPEKTLNPSSSSIKNYQNSLRGSSCSSVEHHAQLVNRIKENNKLANELKGAKEAEKKAAVETALPPTFDTVGLFDSFSKRENAFGANMFSWNSDEKKSHFDK